jgi:hypothetical protein
LFPCGWPCLAVARELAKQRVAVRRDLVDRQRDLLGAAGLGEDEAVALVDRDPAAQVGQREGRLWPSPP